MIAYDIAKAASRLLSMLCGGLGFACFFGAFIAPRLGLFAALFWLCALGLEYAVRENRR